MIMNVLPLNICGCVDKQKIRKPFPDKAGLCIDVSLFICLNHLACPKMTNGIGQNFLLPVRIMYLCALLTRSKIRDKKPNSTSGKHIIE